MAEETNIEWTATRLPDGTVVKGATFNPWIGCTKVSEGCKFCYAEELMDKRYHRVQWGPLGIRERTSDENWAKPLAWERQAARTGVRRRVFCASLADVFEARMDLAPLRLELFDLIRRTPHLDWLILTKRPQHVIALLIHALQSVPGTTDAYDDTIIWLNNWIFGTPPQNVWLGTSAENQQTFNDRSEALREVPAAIRFMSLEPLLGPIDFNLGEITHEKRVHWVIVGGESGTNDHVRPMHPEWVYNIKQQCEAAGVAFFFKQWGEWLPVSEMNEALIESLYHPVPKGQPADSTRLCKVPQTVMLPDGRRDVGAISGSMLMYRVGKKRACRLLGDREYNEMPEALR